MSIINKYKFYFNLLVFYLKNEFKDLKDNMFIIIKNKNMLITFLFLLPVVFYIVKIQIFMGILFIIFYLFLFLLHNNIIKSDYTISCEEIPINTKYLYRYSFINIFIFVPKAKAFLLVYNFLNIFISGNLQKTEKIIFSIIFIIISFVIKTYILLIMGYTFLSILVSSNLIISYFEIISWKYENKKAKYQHIVLNCLLDNKDSVGEADSMKIIIIGDEKVVFNSDKFLKIFLSKVKSSEKFQKAFSTEKNEVTLKNFLDEKNHYIWSLSSLKYNGKNLTKNKTSSPKINSIKEDGSIEKIDCSCASNPRFDGKNKSDYLTRTYELNKEKSIIKEIPESMKFKMQSESKFVYNSIVDDKDEIMLFSENGKIHSRENSPTVSEYSKDSKMSVYDRIKNLKEFEEDNKDYLSSDSGKREYEICKIIVKGGKLNKNSDDSNSPYEDFIN